MADLLGVDEVKDSRLNIRASTASLNDGHRQVTYVCCDSVVPENDGVWLPPSSHLAVNAAIDVVVQKVQDRIWSITVSSKLRT